MGNVDFCMIIAVMAIYSNSNDEFDQVMCDYIYSSGDMLSAL